MEQEGEGEGWSGGRREEVEVVVLVLVVRGTRKEGNRMVGSEAAKGMDVGGEFECGKGRTSG